MEHYKSANNLNESHTHIYIYIYIYWKDRFVVNLTV